MQRDQKGEPMSQPTPVELLDRALACAPGVGAPVEFNSQRARDSFRWRLYAAMSADARRSRREDDPVASDWGKHRWGAVRVERLGDTALWIGRESEFKVGEPAALAPPPTPPEEEPT